MKKAWRIIISIVLIVILLGGVFLGVGLITGADTGRIYSVIDSRYNFTEWMEYFTEVWGVVWSVFVSDSSTADALVMSAG